MYEIDSYGSVAGDFSNGNPSTNTPATVADATWFNALQDEIVGVIENAGLVLDKLDSTQLLQALQLMSGAVPAGGRNLFINGDMRLAQRGLSANFGATYAAPLSGYCLDRWFHQSDTGVGTGSAQVSRVAFTIGQTAVPGDPIYFLRHQQTANATAGNPTVAQKIEGVRGFSSGTRTLSIWLKGLTSYNVTARAVQVFGNGGSPSGSVVVGTSVLAITTGWVKYEVPFTIPSLAGKTLGTAGNDHLLVEFQLPMGATFTFDVSRGQFESGSVAGDFEVRPLSQELALARRYYEKSYEVETPPATNTLLGMKRWKCWNSTASSTFPDAETRFMVEKRGLPAITWYDDIQAARLYLIGGTVSGTNQISRRSTGFPTMTVSGGFVDAGAHWTADSEL